MAKAKPPETQNPPDDQDEKTATKEATKVRVILKEGTLGHLLLQKGDVTDDKQYVELLKTKRGKSLVEAVK